MFCDPSSLGSGQLWVVRCNTPKDTPQVYPPIVNQHCLYICHSYHLCVNAQHTYRLAETLVLEWVCKQIMKTMCERVVCVYGASFSVYGLSYDVLFITFSLNFTNHWCISHRENNHNW